MAARRLYCGLIALMVCAATSARAARGDEPPRLDGSPRATPHPKGYVCLRAARPVAIDGRLDDDVWKNAAWTDNFVDIEGAVKPAPRFATRVKMLWDDTYFYIAAELREPHVWATLTKHDAVIFQDPDFEVFIDPDGDNHEYYELEVNALGTEWDLLLDKPYRDGGPARNEWEIPGLKVATRVAGTLNDASDKDVGWSVELAIPWKVLGEHAHRPAPPRGGDAWRVNFSRVEWLVEVKDGKYVKVPNKPEDNWVWSPQYAVDMHRPEMWGYVQFSTETRKKKAPAFAPDPSWAARDYLMHVYWANKAYFRAHKRYATPQELGLGSFLDGSSAAGGVVQTAVGNEKTFHVELKTRRAGAAVVEAEIDDGSHLQVKVKPAR